MNQGKLTILRATCSSLGLLLLGGCGGGASSPGSTTPGAAPVPPSATVLTYSNPPLGGYSLQAEPASNGTAHLVLDLMGPAGSLAQGVSFFLTADPALVSWSQQGTAYAVPGSAFNLGPAPQAFVTKVSAGGGLQVGIYQKSGAATYGSAPLATLALDLTPGAAAPGSAVALAPTAGLPAVFVDQHGVVEAFPAPIAVGGLVAD